MNGHTCAVLVEPVQGEGGVIVPAPSYVKELRDLCNKNNVLLMLDEIQTGLGRTGKLFAYEHAGIKPDVMMLAKGLGGGMPIGALLASDNVSQAFTPGTHGSTFGGNPLACAVGHAVVGLLETGEYQARARELGVRLQARTADLVARGLLAEARGVGLWAGVDVVPGRGTGRDLAERLLARRVLVKDTHGRTVRLSPPIVIAADDLDWALDQLTDALG